MKLLPRALALAASVAAFCMSSAIWAQTYPQKPISIVVAYPAGGDTDVLARVFAEKLSTRLGQSVVVDNRPGATGIIGTSFVAKAPADGYTLMLTPVSYAFAQLVVKSSPATSYDVLNGFTPIIEAGKGPLFLVAGANSGIKNLKDAVDASKRPTGINYASAGSGSILHILGEMVNKAAGVSFNHVPYKGVAPAINDVLGGHIPVTYISLGTVAPYLGTGQLLPLAVADRQRSALAPTVPTFRELGYNNVELNTWYGVFGPKGMPAEAVKTLNSHLNEIIKMPDVAARMTSLGIVAVGGTPEALAKTNTEDYERVGKIVRELNIRAD